MSRLEPDRLPCVLHDGVEVMSMNEVPVMFTVPQVCRMLQMSRSKVYDLIRRGELPSVAIGATRRIPEDRFRAYLEAL